MARFLSIVGLLWLLSIAVDGRRDGDVCNYRANMASCLTKGSRSGGHWFSGCKDLQVTKACIHKATDFCPKTPDLNLHLEEAWRHLYRLQTACVEKNPYKIPLVTLIPFTSSTTKSTATKSTATKSSTTFSTATKSTTVSMATFTPSPRPQTQQPATVAACEYAAIRHCVWLMSDLSDFTLYYSDRPLMCQAYEKARKCLQDLESRCPDYVAIQMWKFDIRMEMGDKKCNSLKEEPEAEKASQGSDCENDSLMKSCLLTRQIDNTRKDGLNRQPYGQREMCLAVGRSGTCIQGIRHLNYCNPGKLLRMREQIQEQAIQCIHLGYPLNRATTMTQPSIILIVTVAALSDTLHHFL